MNDITQVEAKNPVPMFIVVSSVAMVFLLGAAIGFFEPALVPQLAQARVMWSLLFVGLTLDAGALLMLLGARRKRSRGKHRA